MKNNHQRITAKKPIYLVLEDGSSFGGFSFGAQSEGVTGEVVFNTGMVGYPESFTDPSYKGQILALTYPLIGNYGVPSDFERELSNSYESTRIHISGLVVSEYSEYHHHWTAHRGLSDLLLDQNVPGIEGVDTRALTKILRQHGTMMVLLLLIQKMLNVLFRLHMWSLKFLFLNLALMDLARREWRS